MKLHGNRLPELEGGSCVTPCFLWCFLVMPIAAELEARSPPLIWWKNPLDGITVVQESQPLNVTVDIFKNSDEATRLFLQLDGRHQQEVTHLCRGRAPCTIRAGVTAKEMGWHAIALVLHYSQRSRLRNMAASASFLVQGNSSVRASKETFEEEPTPSHCHHRPPHPQVMSKAGTAAEPSVASPTACSDPTLTSSSHVPPSVNADDAVGRLVGTKPFGTKPLEPSKIGTSTKPNGLTCDMTGDARSAEASSPGMKVRRVSTPVPVEVTGEAARVSIHVLTMARPESLQLLLRSLAASDYGGSTSIVLHVHVDAPPSGADDDMKRQVRKTREVLAAYDEWQHGEFYVGVL